LEPGRCQYATWGPIIGILNTVPNQHGLDACPAAVVSLPSPSHSLFHKSKSIYILITGSGPNCSETKQFIEAANMQGFQTVLHACQAQLKQTSISYSDVDYGIKWKRSYPLRFAAWNTWQRGLSVVACIVSFGLAIPVLWFA
jgi:hypothetical protein